MSEFLLAYLTTHLTPELVQTYIRAGGLIEHFEKDDIYELADGLLMNGDQTDKLNLLDTIYSLHVNTLSNIILSYGIKLNSEYQLIDLCQLLESLLYLEDYDQLDSFVEVIKNSDDDKETTCYLLSVVSIFPEEYFHELIEKVNPDLLNKLLSMSEKVDTKEEIREVDRDTIKFIKSIKEVERFKHSGVFELIRKGMPLSLSLKEYFTLFGAELFNDLTLVDRVVTDLFLLTKIAKGEDILAELLEELDLIVQDKILLSTLIQKVKALSIEVL